MGGLLSYFKGLFGSKELRILILGLDGAGKTTLLYRLQVLLLSASFTSVSTVILFYFSGWWSGNNNSNHWLQCWTSYLQKSKVPSLGPRWSDKYQVTSFKSNTTILPSMTITFFQTLLEVLLFKYWCCDICCWLCWQGQNWNFKAGTGLYAWGNLQMNLVPKLTSYFVWVGRRAEKRYFSRVSQQTRHWGSNVCHRGASSSGIGSSQEPNISDFQSQCNQRRWFRRVYGVVIKCNSK